MKKSLLIIFLMTTILSCQTTSSVVIQTQLPTPPAIYLPNSITNNIDLLKEYRSTLMKITEWQLWYDTSLSTNYFYTND